MRRIRLAGLGIALAGLASYADSFSGRFVFDDNPSITDNLTIRHFGTAFFPPPDATVSGRPLLNLSFALNYAISGLNVWSYHALNLAIHIAAGLVLFGLLRRTWLRAGEKSRGDALPWAFAIAALWTVHPLLTEAVTGVVQRAESLMGLFYLLTLYCLIRGARLCPLDAGSAAAVEPNLWFGLSWLACLLGMATKEVMVTAPVVAFFYDRTFLAGSFGQAWLRRWRYYLGLASSWILLGVLVASTGGNRSGSVGFGVGVSWWSYGLTQFRAIARYLRLALWPSPLIFDYGTYWVKGASEVVLPALLVVPLAGATLWALARRPKLGFLGLAFFAVLAPTSLMPGTAQMTVEYRMYLPLAAVLTAIALGSRRLIGSRGAIALFLATAVACVFATARRNRDYRDSLTIWSDTVAKRPDSARAHYGLGYAYFQAGQNDAAIGQFEQALQLQPDARGHVSMGSAWLQVGRTEEAVAEFQEAIRLDPANVKARDYLGNALARSGRDSEAIAQYEAALRLDPEDSDTRNNLGDALLRAGRGEEALAQYREVLRRHPSDDGTRNNLGSALARMGRIGEAIGQYQEAVRLNPENAEAHGNLGSALFQVGRRTEALTQFEEAVRLQPNNEEAHGNLGSALFVLDRTQEAAEQYWKALELNPGDASAHNSLGCALLKLGRTAEAADQCREAVRLAPDDADDRFNLGAALTQAGLAEEAAASYREALRLRPGDEAAIKALRSLGAKAP